MSSAKTERLVNLTMALLASRRFLTKGEIFRRVAGYSGSQETKERMFERDKDDLRALGIEIEVGGHDPAFEDEPGYRILPERYQLPAESFSPSELGLIAVALDLWRGSELETESESVLRRFNSLGITAEQPDGFSLAHIKIDQAGLVEISEALSSRRTVGFNYQKVGSANDEMRKINIMGICGWQGAWYLIGEDLDRGDIRVFRLDRITSSIEMIGKAKGYEIPSDFNVRDYLVMFNEVDERARLHVRAHHGQSLRTRALDVKPVDGEWDEIVLPLSDLSTLCHEIFWSGNDVIVQEPLWLREQIVTSLQKIEKRYV
jgi:proteasome accessory factor B